MIRRAHYEHSVIGYNYRMSNLLAAVGRAQLATLGERVEARRRIFDSYVERLGDIDGRRVHARSSLRTVESLADDAHDRPDAVRGGSRRRLARARRGEHRGSPGLEADAPPAGLRRSRVFGGAVSEQIFETGICLPSGTGMTDDQIDRIAALVRSVGAA